MKKQNQLNLLFPGRKINVEKPILRPYQSDGVSEMRDLVTKGILRIVLVLPTGGGKTVLASHIIESAVTNFERRVIFVAHRVELINQTAKQLARFGVTDIGVIRGNDQRVNTDARVQVASIDTLRRREKPLADIIFIDECHRSLADSYAELFAHYPNALFIGLTATPFRTDNQGLGGLFQALVVCAKPSQLIEDGFIVSPKIFAGRVHPDLSDVSYSAMSHDYHNAQLAAAMQKPTLVGNVVEEWKKHAKGRRTVVFAVNVEHSKTIVDTFKNAGVRAEHIDGTTSEEERTLTLLKLEKNEIQIISNCDILSEGWDQPSVKCLILLRPTKSARLHLQQCGRILRPWSDDLFSDAPTDALILDHAGNCMEHGLPQQDRHFDLAVGQKKSQSDDIILRTCESCYCIWSGASRVCPECGYEMPQKERKPLQHDETVQLRELNVKTILTVEDQQRQFYLHKLQECREKGMRIGAAAHKFKDKFGKWPPYSWTGQAKSMMEADLAWCKAIEDRAKVREHWQAKMAVKHEEMTHGPSRKDDGFTEEPEENTSWQDNSITEDEIPF